MLVVLLQYCQGHPSVFFLPDSASAMEGPSWQMGWKFRAHFPGSDVYGQALQKYYFLFTLFGMLLLERPFGCVPQQRAVKPNTYTHFTHDLDDEIDDLFIHFKDGILEKIINTLKM